MRKFVLELLPFTNTYTQTTTNFNLVKISGKKAIIEDLVLFNNKDLGVGDNGEFTIEASKVGTITTNKIIPFTIGAKYAEDDNTVVEILEYYTKDYINSVSELDGIGSVELITYVLSSKMKQLYTSLEIAAFTYFHKKFNLDPLEYPILDYLSYNPIQKTIMSYWIAAQIIQRAIVESISGSSVDLNNPTTSQGSGLVLKKAQAGSTLVEFQDSGITESGINYGTGIQDTLWRSLVKSHLRAANDMLSSHYDTYLDALSEDLNSLDAYIAQRILNPEISWIATTDC